MRDDNEVFISPPQETHAYLPTVVDAPRPDESLRKHARIGWIILGVFFGIGGLWALTAPLNGAVVANAEVKVDGNRKAIQHLEGGIVKQLNVKEGDRVKAGDVLIVLDETQTHSEYKVLVQQQRVLRATEARLSAELNHNAQLTPPSDIQAQLGDPDMQNVWASQLKVFDTRKMSNDGQRKIIGEKINQLKEQINGSQQQVVAYGHQAASVRKELASITPLVERGIIAQPRRLQLERTAYGLDGQIAETKAEAARAKQAIAEEMQQLDQLDNDKTTDVAKELRDTQAMLLEVTPRLSNAKATLDRMEIRSPYAGKVVGLNIFSVGAVVERGQKVLDIVPDNEALTIEAQVGVQDISDVHPGMAAQISLTAYKQRITPTIGGEVIQVSADRLTDNRTGFPYYTALVRINEKELAEYPEVRLYPGMPARIMIPTVERTAFDYFVGPLVSSLDGAFRQK